MLRATFIGVDKYTDSTVRELTGAVRDAIALWALVSDTMPAVASRLIVNADATTATIRAALQETLASASEDDTVIFYIFRTRNSQPTTRNTQYLPIQNTCSRATTVLASDKQMVPCDRV